MREPEKALEALRLIKRDYIEFNYFDAPKALWMGLAQRMAGRPEAARIEWQSALRVVEEHLSRNATKQRSLANKARLLALLGEKDQANDTLRLCEQLSGNPVGRPTKQTFWIYAELGRDQELADYLHDTFDTAPRGLAIWVARFFLLDSAFDAVRARPSLASALAKARRLMASGARESATPTTTDTQSAAADKSVAVLAFTDLSAAHDSEYFSDGISDELINALGKVPGLKVPGRTSSFHFKGKNVPVPEIAQQLGVAYVIEGSVQRAGDKVKIGARLTKAADGFQVWSDSFLRDAKDVFAVEEEIAGIIAKNLSLKLGASSPAATASVNPQAFEAYLQGRQAWNRRTRDGYEKATTSFKRAIDLDSGFARAYVGLADVLDVGGWDDGSIGRWDQRNSDVLIQIHGLLARAVALDPDLAEAHASLGGSLYDAWNYPAALSESRRAVQLNPNYATGWHWLGEILWDRGEMDEALVDLRRAADLDPFSLAIAAAYSLCLRDAGRPLEALAAAERAGNLQPGTPRALGAQAVALLDLGRTEEAARIARELLNSEDGRDWWQTGTIVVRAGLPDEAAKLLEQYRRPGSERLAAPLLALLGRRDEFLAVWQTRPMVTNQPWYLWEPGLDPLRQDPKFLQVLEQVGLAEAHARVQAWRKAHPPEKPAAKD